MILLTPFIEVNTECYLVNPDLEGKNGHYRKIKITGHSSRGTPNRLFHEYVFILKLGSIFSGGSAEAKFMEMENPNE